MSGSKGLPKMERLKARWRNSKLTRKPTPTRQERFKSLTRLEKLKELWAICQSEHADCQSFFMNTPEFQFEGENKIVNLKVIDVCTNRVVFAPDICKYFALSYVWGNVPPYQLTKENFQQSLTFGEGSSQSYFQLSNSMLAPTISDAMIFTKEMGEQYLWVDSLCIFQDDAEEMHTMIQAMDQIYKASILTIVAANGENPQAGIPLSNIELSSAFYRRDKVPDLDLTIWGQRGWTYQEHEFSGRAVIFDKRQAFYECRRGIFNEFDAQTPIHRDDVDLEKGIGKGLPYERHVEKYSKRHLTHEYDILNAFTAILADAHTRYGITTCWGLPKETFSSALMWQRNNQDVPWSRLGPLHRRIAQHPGSTNFPSWSWAGWVGGVDYLLELEHGPLQQGSRRFQSAVVWPWERDYDISPFHSQNVDESGILTVLADVAAFSSLYEILLSKKYSIDPIRWDRWHLAEPGEMTGLACMLIGYSDVEARAKHARKGNHVFLIVYSVYGVIYERRGIGMISKILWTAIQPEQKLIKLG